jgi:hypothetical protein
MKTHVQVLGILFLVSAAFLAFLAVAFPLGLGIIGAIVGRSDDPDAATGIAVMGLVGTGLAIFFAVLAIVWGICGYGVLKHKPWARIFAIILCAMSLVKIPIGTAFGIYGLWVMFNKETEAIFANAPRA